MSFIIMLYQCKLILPLPSWVVAVVVVLVVVLVLVEIKNSTFCLVSHLYHLGLVTKILQFLFSYFRKQKILIFDIW